MPLLSPFWAYFLSNSFNLSPIAETGVIIGLCVNTDKMEYMCFNQSGDIFTLKTGSETSGQVHLLWKQRLINQKWHQYTTSKSMNSYLEAIFHMEVRPIQ